MSGRHDVMANDEATLGRAAPDPVGALPTPVGAPNVVAIMLDDTGFAQLGCFGSDIATPHLDRLAADGLRYNRFHVTALCSPTRAAFLSGRNHHAVGMGFLPDVPLASPGYSGRLSPTAATLPRLMRDAGYSTLAVGKWHLTPRFERSAAGPFDRWPLGLGFERYYGFLQGGVNHWAPNLVCDNHYIDPPATPAEGYHLTEDLTDTAIRLLHDQQNGAPGKPFFLYFAPGATHAPHHVRSEWTERYHGRFDQGWDTWRDEVFARQLVGGVVPSGTVLTPRPAWVPAWDELDADRRRMYARQHEVFAGFLTHTDAQIGRLVDFLRRTGQLENTLILVFSDNGASAEGGVEGSVNEHRFSAHVRDSLPDNLARYEDWGGERTYNHYAWGWAWAGNTPFRLWKRYTWLGGTRTPLIVHWSRGVSDPGSVRSQFTYVTDLTATVLDAAGIDPPARVDGVEQQPLHGASLRASFTDPDSAGVHPTQYFEMLGSRSIVHEQWKATTDHVSVGVPDEQEQLTGSRRFADDHWALFDLAADFSEADDVSAEHPELVAELQQRWLAEAERHQVLPIRDTLVGEGTAFLGPAWPAGPDQTYTPGAGPVHDESLPRLSAGFRITAEVDAAQTSDGVLCALGDWNGGFALFAVDGHLTFTVSRAGEITEIEASVPVPPGSQHLSVSYQPGGDGSGVLRLHHGHRGGDTVVAERVITGGFPSTMQHGGAHLRLGHDTGLPVSPRCAPPAVWNGTLHSIRVQTPPTGRADPHTEVRAALHAD